MVYKTTTVEVDVDIDLEDFDTDDLINELENRGYDYHTQDIYGDYNKEILDQIYHLRRQNKDYQSELDTLIYNIVGRIC